MKQELEALGRVVKSTIRVSAAVAVGAGAVGCSTIKPQEQQAITSTPQEQSINSTDSSFTLNRDFLAKILPKDDKEQEVKDILKAELDLLQEKCKAIPGYIPDSESILHANYNKKDAFGWYTCRAKAGENLKHTVVVSYKKVGEETQSIMHPYAYNKSITGTETFGYNDEAGTPHIMMKKMADGSISAFDMEGNETLLIYQDRTNAQAWLDSLTGVIVAKAEAPTPTSTITLVPENPIATATGTPPPEPTITTSPAPAESPTPEPTAAPTENPTLAATPDVNNPLVITTDADGNQITTDSVSGRVVLKNGVWVFDDPENTTGLDALPDGTRVFGPKLIAEIRGNLDRVRLKPNNGARNDPSQYVDNYTNDIYQKLKKSDPKLPDQLVGKLADGEIHASLSLYLGSFPDGTYAWGLLFGKGIKGQWIQSKRYLLYETSDKKVAYVAVYCPEYVPRKRG